MKHNLILTFAILTVTLLVGCGSKKQEPLTYQTISMAELSQRFDAEENAILLDVRHPEEYAEGHIPGAIHLDNDDIGTQPIGLLPDKDQTIFVYCRSGRRSKEAAQKLVELGYSGIIECGGILDWTGELEK